MTRHWGISDLSLEYRPVGAGSYHWSTPTHWITVDRAPGEAAFARLDRALRTARGLRLDFVVAPLPTDQDRVLVRVAPGWAMSVFPLIDGVAGEFGEHPPEDRAAVTDLLIALHAVPLDGPAEADLPGSDLARTDLRLPGRDRLEAALADAALADAASGPWTSGPYAEPVRQLLAGHAATIRAWLAEFDDLAAAVRAAGTDWVITHGEPHPGNILRTPTGLRMIDWDTVLVAPPERDLWMIPDQVARYAAGTGRAVTAAGLTLYRRWWALSDVTVYVTDLRRPHTAGGDAADALTYLSSYFSQ
ncbi:phosphotransferase [Paractinoplanes rishiriensis]|uniref:phosphotransferase n=1 Tax=Paractinoplanes rishiriensis TaxID=1050105 RepID=UPI001EF3CF97|nr:phosphotransferase [Actinoplanes rishiriensis]